MRLALVVIAAAGVLWAAPEVRYRHAGDALRGAVVREFTLAADQWTHLRAWKQDGGRFDVWALNERAPRRYIFQEGGGRPREWRHAVTGEAVLPASGGRAWLLPRLAGGGAEAAYLGHRYVRVAEGQTEVRPPDEIEVVNLRPDLLVGPAHNTRPKDDTRRWDGSDYELVRLTRDDYREMAAAGISCVNVDGEQAPWAEELGLYYWGAGASLPFPEMLYRSQYLGPALFLDEPAVSTRDHVLRPRLLKDEAFRRSITPADALQAFRAYFDGTLEKGAPAVLNRMLASREDVDLGEMRLVQENLYSWETMPSTAAWQLTRDARVPEAFVFEPPGRVGTHRTLPEFNMTYGTQFAADDARALTSLIYSFLRGAARLAGKNWGVSIYGAVNRADAPFWLTHAYDLGATRFHFWDTYQLACVPYREYLALARHLRNHAASRPRRDLERLRRAAEVAITLPPGYGLGHVLMGRGNLWGLNELNLERLNGAGVNYRTVMSNFFLEAERCLRLGVAFDAMWELEGWPPQGYRERVRIREDGKVEVETAGRRVTLDQARQAARPDGEAPSLALRVQGRSAENGVRVSVTAEVVEKSAPVYYTHGTDREGVYRNAMVLWELFGPGEEDYRQVMPEGMRPRVRREGSVAHVNIDFLLERPGRYRLRAATVDTAGRTRVVWRELDAARESTGGRLVLK